MAGATLTYTVVTGIDDAHATLERLQDTRVLVLRLSEYLLRSTQNRYSTQVGPDGVKWKELSPEYQKRKKYNADKVLTLRGYLRRSYRYQMDGDSSAIGTNVKYAARHQFGGTFTQKARSATVRYKTVAGRTVFAKKTAKKATSKTVNIGEYTVTTPARPALGISMEDETKIKNIVGDWLARR